MLKASQLGLAFNKGIVMLIVSISVSNKVRVFIFFSVQNM